jgi:hypothetical protein
MVLVPVLVSKNKIGAGRFDFQKQFSSRKALPGFFLCNFSSLTSLKKNMFSAKQHRPTTALRHRSQIMEGPVLSPSFSLTELFLSFEEPNLELDSGFHFCLKLRLESKLVWLKKDIQLNQRLTRG